MSTTARPLSLYHHSACPVCAHPDSQPYLRCRDFTLSQQTFDLVQCRNCGFVYTNPIPPEDAIGPYYQSAEYFSHNDHARGLLPWLYRSVRRVALRRKARHVAQQSGLETGRLLDVGCGTGAFAHQMQQRGWSVLGLEPDPAAREYAQRTWVLRVEPSDALYQLPAASRDVITLWHVLEHIHRLDDALQALYQTLAPQGTLLIAVPNCSSHDADHYREHWAAYDVPRHLYHFTPPTLTRLTQRHGFAVTHIEPMPFDAYYVSLLSERYRTGHTRWLAAAWQGWRSNRIAARAPQRASSLIYTLRKK